MGAVTEESSSEVCGEGPHLSTQVRLYHGLRPGQPESLAYCWAAGWHPGCWRNGSSGIISDCITGQDYKLAGDSHLHGLSSPDKWPARLTATLQLREQAEDPGCLEGS